MYVDYNYYSNVYKGKAKEEEFTNLEIKAASTLNYYTFNRIEEVTENIKLAICELIDFIKEDEDNQSREIESESVGSYSVKYQKQSVYTKQKNKKRILNKYLGHTNLLYRGGYYIY